MAGEEQDNQLSVTVLIEADQEAWIQKMIKKKRFHNRTHAIQFCIEYTKDHLKED